MVFAGNTVVAKPASTTPLSTCLLAEIWNEILPPGVFNVICGGNDLGDAITSHPYDDLDDAVDRANSTEYGLGATVWGRDLDRTFAVAMRLEAGLVWVNQHMAFAFDVTARGAKHSGLGEEFGPEGFDAYTQAYVVNQTSW